MENTIRNLEARCDELVTKSDRLAVLIAEMHAARVEATEAGDTFRVNELTFFINKRRDMYNKTRGTLAGIRIALHELSITDEA